MSFGYNVKGEICHNKGLLGKHKKALLYGLMLFAKDFNKEKLALTSENKSVAKLYSDISDLVAFNGSLTTKENKRMERNSYTVTVDDGYDRLCILNYFGYTGILPPDNIIMDNLQSNGDIAAFISGAFLACGTLSDPEKGYHLEFNASFEQLIQDLAFLLSDHIGTPKMTTRRNDFIVYYKESEQIEELLTYMGASKATLELMEVKMIKGLRNRVNRQTNCETANITRTITAGLEQSRQIKRLIDRYGAVCLPEELRELAVLRLDNADMSLSDLGRNLSSPLSRSGVNYRLVKILEIAKQLLEKK